MSQRSLNRTVRTMRTMLVNAKQGNNPSLQAVTTIYNNLLMQGGKANSGVWSLFSEVASLQLTMPVLDQACNHGLVNKRGTSAVYEHGCDSYPKCNHRNVTFTKLVSLLDDGITQLTNGRTLAKQRDAGWWGQAISKALGV